MANHRNTYGFAWVLWVHNLSTLANYNIWEVESAYETRQACVIALQWRWVGLKMIQTKPDERSTTKKVKEIIRRSGRQCR